MPTYVALLKWTPQGLKDVKQSPSRLDAARKGFQAAGVTMKTFYMTMGQYDMVGIVEAPDDATLARRSSRRHPRAASCQRRAARSLKTSTDRSWVD